MRGLVAWTVGKRLCYTGPSCHYALKWGSPTLIYDTIATYRGLTLDPFQQEAIRSVEAGQSVLISAPTGTGKTLVADYIIEKSFREGRRVVYTAPIKALSNQKFKEFKRLLGDEHVGILTGDVVIQPEAPILIMTTEIFRNLLHTDRHRLSDVAYVIFDEIHYIDDPHRGSVWEESLIFMPDEMRFLGLSATIPNVDELAEWIESVHGRPVAVIRHGERAVPLKHHLFERSLGICDRDRVMKRYKRRAQRMGTTDSGRIRANMDPTTHLDLLQEIVPEYLPILFFTFSRRRCESHAKDAAEVHNLLNDEERAQVRRVLDSYAERHPGAGARRLIEIEPLLMRGIAYHHAGMLPLVKDVVEDLFEAKLIRLLYCTETFAVGLNFPCRTVCFDAVTKWDGTAFRALSNREYFQMAGRAGRRGLDEVGYVFTVVDFNFFSPAEFPTMSEDDVEPLRSRFTLTYNTVLNLVANYSPEEIHDVLEKNFASYQTRRRMEYLEKQLLLVEAQLAAAPQKGKSRRQRRAAEDGKPSLNPAKLKRRRVSLKRQLRELGGTAAFHAEFEAKRSLLVALDYLTDDGLTSRGLFAARIYGSELLVTELFFRGVFHDWSADEVNALAVSIDYEPRKGEVRPRKTVFDMGTVLRTVNLLQKMEQLYIGYTLLEFNAHLGQAAFAWSQGATFAEVAQGTQVDEGDLVYAMRRGIDILRQVRNAAREDPSLAAKLSDCIKRMDRDEVSVLL